MTELTDIAERLRILTDIDILSTDLEQLTFPNAELWEQPKNIIGENPDFQARTSRFKGRFGIIFNACFYMRSKDGRYVSVDVSYRDSTVEQPKDADLEYPIGYKTPKDIIITSISDLIELYDKYAGS